MNNREREITLAQPITYQIKVLGVLNMERLISDEILTLTIENNREGKEISIITSNVDQAALHGLLRRLYVYGLPLISIVRIGSDQYS